jgi:hypothetical protein
LASYITIIHAGNRIGDLGKFPGLCLLLVILALANIAAAQRVAILAPDRAEKSASLAEKLASHLGNKLRVLDNDLSHAAYLSTPHETPFNLTTEESKRIGAAIGCDAFILVRSVNQRRSALGRSEYYEAYATLYLVSSRSGRLNWWKLLSYEAATPGEADQLLTKAIEDLAGDIAARIRSFVVKEMNEPEPGAIEEVPDEKSPQAKNFRAPVPYLRIKPAYTPLAAFYEVTATVDALVDLDAAGEIGRIEISRWAGFGLDESVEAAIRKMNWRPAERNGKPLPMRFLLRYNFKKIDKEPPH